MRSNPRVRIVSTTYVKKNRTADGKNICGPDPTFAKSILLLTADVYSCSMSNTYSLVSYIPLFVKRQKKQRKYFLLF